ncbi:uroporphyrinogen-III synthase HemD family protein [Chlamydia ibidis]|uniref:Uroporphyrinogen-III synthase HemD family protein n=2 Tax=Chlamydia ibidis TaxID=1405396 RepID=S7KGU1_9CHLA|nr:uroporphyrinogen-III synthase [Chlamydia ibidis]EPP35386.1 uroporphyrinogen-III synthase HemD family protein [Chlamydia ibidis]EQM63200.1 uroporphyrinogen-III synthase HemD family protein [Chlamydia ibidis 10-1398/6]
MTLYLGLNKQTAKKYQADFLPILRVSPYSLNCPQLRKASKYLEKSTHVIITSPSSTSLFISKMKRAHSLRSLREKYYICIGQATEQRLKNLVPKAKIITAKEETSEGIVPILKSCSRDCYFLYPHSALSRPIIKKFLQEEHRKHFAYAHYNVRPVALSVRVFGKYKNIILTSPSGVRAYARIFPNLPNKHHWCLGPITFNEFKKIYNHPPLLFSN